MKNRINYIVVICLICINHSCDKSNEQQGTPNVTIKSIWISDKVDDDDDGYSSYARLNFDLDTDFDESDVTVKLGVRDHSTNATQTYDVYFESAFFTIVGATSEDAVYIDIGSPNDELSKGRYDFLLQVFESSDPTEVIAEASPETYAVLSDNQFERSSEEEVLVEEWISYIDDGILESYFTYYPRYPTGSIVHSLTEKFNQPSNAVSCTIKKVRIHFPNIYTNPIQVSFTIQDDESDEPKNTLFTSDSYTLQSTGWNVFDIEYTITDYPVFYISVPTSLNYAVGVDNNSATSNGYQYYYVSSNPPQEGWRQVDYNYGIEVFVEYYVSGD